MQKFTRIGAILCLQFKRAVKLVEFENIEGAKLSDNSDDRTIGTLAPENFSLIENVLVRRQILAPILSVQNVPAELRDFYFAYSDWTEHCVQTVKERFKISADVSFCFVASLTANAFAHRALGEDRKYFIAIFLGAMAWRKTFQEMLQNVKFQSYLYLDASSISDSFLAKYSFTLSALVLRWIVFHELAHIKNGHLHLPSHSAFGATSSEITKRRKGQIDRNITKHCLEMDADSFASTQLLSELRTIGPDANDDWPLLDTDERRIKTLFVIVYVALRLFDRGTPTPGEIFHLTHPIGLVRFLQIGAWSQAYSSRHEFLTPEKCGELSAQCIEACEPTLRAMGVGPVHGDFEQFLSEDGHSKYGERMLARWAKIRPRLEPNLLGGRLEPAQVRPL